jgi:hypothetical protein
MDGTSANTNMRHLLYKTICKQTGHFYIGIHSSEKEDAWYLGSGTKLREMVKALCKSAFERIPLALFETRTLLEEAETQTIQANWKHPLSLNVRTSSKGWFKDRSCEEKKAICDKISQSLRNSSKAKAAAANRPPPSTYWTEETLEKIASNRLKKARERWSQSFQHVDLNSIDFSKFGWVQRVADQTGLKPQKVSRIMRELHPHIYETAFKRNGSQALR